MNKTGVWHKETARIVLTGLRHGVLEVLLFLPLLVAAVFFVPDISQAGRVLLIVSSPLLYPAGWLIAHRLKLRSRLLRLLCATIAGAAASLPLLQAGGWQGLAAAVLAAAMFARGTRLVALRSDELLPLAGYMTGLSLYVIASIAVQLSNQAALQNFKDPLLYCGLLALLVTLLTINMAHLRSGARDASDKPLFARGVRSGNRTQLLLWFAIALALASFRQIEALLGWLRAQINAWLQSLKQEPAAPPEPEQPLAQPLPMEGLFPGEEEAPSPIWTWLEQIVTIVAFVALAAGVILLGYVLLKRLPGWLSLLGRWLATRMKWRLSTEEEPGFVDEEESLTRDKLPRRSGLQLSLAERLRARRGANAFDRLSNEEKIRYLYRRTLQLYQKAGYPLRPALTPRETWSDLQQWRLALAHPGKAASGERAAASQHSGSGDTQPSGTEQLCLLYEEVRYGMRRVSDQEVSSLLQHLPTTVPAD